MMHPYVTGVGGTTFSSPLTTCSFDPAPSGCGCPPVAMCLHFSKSVSLLLHFIAEIANSSTEVSAHGISDAHQLFLTKEMETTLSLIC